MVSAGNFIKGQLVLISGILIAIIVSWQIGFIMDLLFGQNLLISAFPVINNPNNPWVAVAANSSPQFEINVIYACCYLIVLLAIYIDLQYLFAEQGGDTVDSQGFTRFRRG